MSGSDFVEMFVGVGASRVRDLFEQGKAHAPCIIFIDEIDAVGRHRGAGLGGGHDEREQTLNQLLVEMDGFESNEGVILLAATNRPDVLDPALLRPGRFDRQVVVDAPDVKGREGILRVHLRKVPISDDVNVRTIAKATPGMSGADLANLVNEGALLAARRGHDKVTMADLEDSKDKVMLGAERRSMVLSDAERKLTAYHEAGHAVVAVRLPGLDPVHKITIVPRGRALGVTASLPEEDRHSYTREYLISSLAMLYGGRAAEAMVFGPEKITTGAANDIERATAMARRMVTQFGMSPEIGPMAVGDSEHEVFLGREIGQRRQVSEAVARQVDSEIKNLLDTAYDTAERTLTANRELLEQIAEALLERETLDREEVDLLAAGEKLPEAKLVSRAREFAETLRREISSGATADKPSGSAEGQRSPEGRKSDVEVPVSAEREADATS
jgi:cell division protease FtsH